MSATDWESTLDAFQERLDAQWAVYRDGLTEPVVPFEPPAVTSPIPPQFVARAAELLQRCRALEETLAAAMEMARSDLDRLGPSGGAAPAEPVYFDSRV